MTDPNFGRYLASVQERDIDLLLMEEFHVTAEFVTWFCDQLGLADARSTGAWHSVSDTDGETDLLLTIAIDTARYAVLIENKVSAGEQDRQAERYHIRGERMCESGQFDGYHTVICAPQKYLEDLPADSAYHHRISYEAITGWFDGRTGGREVWRGAVMREAIDQSRRGYTMIVDPAMSSFHLQYWQHLKSKHPKIRMHKPSQKGSSSTWIYMKGIGFPADVSLNHKFDQQSMDLGFRGRTVEQILAVQPFWPEDIIVVQKGKIASLEISVPFIDMRSDISKQLEAVEGALVAAYRLIPFASLFVPLEWQELRSLP